MERKDTVGYAERESEKKSARDLSQMSTLWLLPPELRQRPNANASATDAVSRRPPSDTAGMGVGTRFSRGGVGGRRRGSHPNRLQRADGCRVDHAWRFMWACVRRRARARAVCLEVVCVSARERPVKITPRLTDDNSHARSLVGRFSFWFLAAPFSRLSGIV